MSREWRTNPGWARRHDAWKRDSRALILRICSRLVGRGWSMAACAEIWDGPIGVRWFAPLMSRARREAGL